MSQISPPMRIVLVAAVALLGVYMLFLRPKPASVEAPPAAATPAGNVDTGKPAVTGLGKAVEAAKGAAATEAGEGAKGGSAQPASASKPATGSAAKQEDAAAKAPPVDTTGLPAAVAKAIKRHKVMALLFTNGRSADDRAVQAAMKKVDRFHGDVYTQAAPMKAIAHYGRITRGADVEQSPTVVVVDRKLRATTLVGYVDRVTIQQAVVDAARATGGLFRDPYLKRVNDACSAAGHDIIAIPQAATAAQTPTALRRRVERFDRFVTTLRSKPAPARWRAYHRGLVADATALQSVYHRQLRALGTHPTAVHVAVVRATLDRESRPLSKRFTRRADRQDLVFCGRLG